MSDIHDHHFVEPDEVVLDAIDQRLRLTLCEIKRCRRFNFSIPPTNTSLAEAGARNMTIDELANQLLNSIVNTTAVHPEPATSLPLTGEAWWRAFAEMNRTIRATVGQYPPGFQVDDSRDAIYDERLRSQM